jgi:hypothetical protein
MIEFEFQRMKVNSYISVWYAMRGSNCVATIVKHDDTRTEAHPFKVSFATDGDFKLKKSFWPKTPPTMRPGNVAGNLNDAKQFILNSNL